MSSSPGVGVGVGAGVGAVGGDPTLLLPCHWTPPCYCHVTGPRPQLLPLHWTPPCYCHFTGPHPATATSPDPSHSLPARPACVMLLPQLGLNLGLKGLQHLLGALPSWLSYTEKEKLEVRVCVWGGGRGQPRGPRGQGGGLACVCMLRRPRGGGGGRDLGLVMLGG